MPRSLAKQVTIPNLPVRTLDQDYNDYSKGMNTYVSNDALGDKVWRLVNNGRMPTLGEYETRKGVDFYSVPIGETEDDTETSTTGAADQTFGTASWKGQKFTASTAGRLTYVEVRLKNDATATGDVVVALYTDSSGEPGVLISSTSIKASTLTATYDYYKVRFYDAPAVSSSTDYWVVVYTDSSGSGSYKWSSTTNSTDGVTSSNSGGTWSTTAYSLNFKVGIASDYAVKGLQRIYKSDGTGKTLKTVNDTLYEVNPSTGATTAVKSALNTSMTYLRGTVVNDTFYYVNGYDGLRKWDFNTESQVNTNDYQNIVEHKGMLFLVDAEDPNKVVFSNFADYETFTSTDFIYVPSPKTGDPVTALASLNGTLIIFTRFNKYILYGTDNATYQLEQAPGRKGTFSQETIYYDKNFIYFLSDDGVYRFNGTTDELISKSNYEDVKQLRNKQSCTVLANKGRLYVWYRDTGQSYNSKCFVYNLDYDALESYDTNSYVSRVAVDATNGDVIVGSSVSGQCNWFEQPTNDYSNMGQGYEFRLETHNMHFGTPSRAKEIRFWKPRVNAQSGDYTINCAYASDLRDRFTVKQAVDVQGTGTTYGSGATWGNFTWGTTKELQSDLNIPGDFRRIAIAYYHDKPRQPHLFLGHTFIVEMRDIR